MSLPQIPLVQKRFDARQVLARLAQPLERFRLAGSELKPQAENLLGEFALLNFQLLRIRIAQLFNSPGHGEKPPARVTNFFGIGSLCAARSSASLAVARSTPAISNITRPGFTGATQRSGAPLPLPMRVSAGFLVNGLSGKIRIQSLPPRLMNRVMATREASIWRSVIHAASMAFRPYSPKESSPPRQAFPQRRPRCCLRYFTFFGINMTVRSSLPGPFAPP